MKINKMKINKMKINIDVDVNVKEVENGKFVCEIPMINAFFGASDVEMINEKTKAMIELFCNEYKE